MLLGKDEMYDLIEVRGAIELWSMYILTEKINRDNESIKSMLKDLEAELENMKTAADKGNPEEMVKVVKKIVIM